VTARTDVSPALPLCYHIPLDNKADAPVGSGNVYASVTSKRLRPSSGAPGQGG
jgi:hypothetical protein